jgi:hypothetical protein
MLRNTPSLSNVGGIAQDIDFLKEALSRGEHSASKKDYLTLLRRVDAEVSRYTIGEKSAEAKSLDRSGEPGRTRTSNPLIKSFFWRLFRENDLASTLSVTY